MQRPTLKEHAPYFSLYIDKVPEMDILEALGIQSETFPKLLMGVSDEKSSFRYEPDKWSIKELTGHILETERIMAYRALCISRNEKNNLPSFDQDDYVKETDYTKVTMESLLDEFAALRKANILMLKSFTEEMCLRKGLANNKPISVRALAYVIYGHVRHHEIILKEKYL